MAKATTKAQGTKAKVKAAPKVAKAKSTKPMIKVTRMRSAIGRRYDQEQSLRGLGLSRRGMSKLVEDTPSIRGMINRVKHLVVVEQA
ncbi:MAG: 50S ribosomal protein L30 [Alphaproteobacteria bacterium]|nr:50S ribosomal protein L30 [Alphaproteobacteria bacterium]